MSNQEPNKENEYDLTGIPPLKEDFTLEEILAEYGGSLEQTLMRQAEAEIRAEAPEEGERPDTAGASSPPRSRTGLRRRRRRPRRSLRRLGSLPCRSRGRCRPQRLFSRSRPAPSPWRRWWAAPWTR